MIKYLVIFVLTIAFYVVVKLTAILYDANNQFFWGWMSGVFIAGCVKIFTKDD